MSSYSLLTIAQNEWALMIPMPGSSGLYARIREGKVDWRRQSWSTTLPDALSGYEDWTNLALPAPHGLMSLDLRFFVVPRVQMEILVLTGKAQTSARRTFTVMAMVCQ